MNKDNNHPSQRVLGFFRWFCNPQFQEELEGDLLERFEMRSEYMGRRRNKLTFVKDVMTLFKPRFMGSAAQLASGFFKMIVPFLSSVPEYYLILLVFLCGYTTPYYIGPKTVVILSLLALQIYFKHKGIWTGIAILMLLANLYMILALLSEFSEFPLFTLKAQQMLFGASAIIIFNIAMCGALIVKYAGIDKRLVFGYAYFLTNIVFILGMLGMSNRFPAHATSGILFGTGTGLLLANFLVAFVVIYRELRRTDPGKNIQNVS